MASTGPSVSGSGGSHSKLEPPTALQMQQMRLEESTQLFYKQLEILDKQRELQRSIEVGLAPQLLAQQSNKIDTPNKTISSASHIHGGDNGAHSQQKISQDHHLNAPAANSQGQSPDLAMPSEIHVPHQPTHQQQPQASPTTKPSQAHSAYDTKAVVLKSMLHRQTPPTPSHSTVQGRQDRDYSRTRRNCNTRPTTQGIAAGSRVVKPPQQEYKTTQAQPHVEQRGRTPAGQIHSSKPADNNWSQVEHQRGEQQQIKVYELEQVQGGRWQPKNGWDTISQDLPDSVAFSLDFNDSDYDAASQDGARGCPDIRNTVGEALDLAPKVHGEGFYNKTLWYEYADKSKSQEWRPTYCQVWVKQLENEKWPIAIFLKIQEMPHDNCDVQTSNGWLMAPVDYPETYINPAELGNVPYQAVVSRRLKATSASRIMEAEYHSIRYRIDQREGNLKWDDSSSSSTAPPTDQLAEQPGGQLSTTGQLAPSSTQAYVNGWPVFHHGLEDKIAPCPRKFEALPPPTYLKISCFLRPAEEKDLPFLLDIYNWEVAHGMQALDTKPLYLKDMERVFKQCMDAKTPIIVAVAGTIAEAKARKATTVLPESQKDQVIGFAFVSIPAPGLAGDVHYNVGRSQGQVHIYVAHECRRKGIGRALLQRTTIFCSRNAGLWAQEYQWYDPERTARYDDAFYNSRSYSALLIEAASRAQDDPGTLWMSKFLDTEDFFLVSTKDNARKVSYCQGGEMVKCLVWQHDCQDVDKMKENDPKRK